MNKHLEAAKQLVSNGDYLEAAEICRKVIKKKQDVVLAKRVLAECLYNIGMNHFRFSGLLDEAENNFRAAIEADPKHLNAIANLGAVLGQRGYYEEAIDCFRRGLQQDPANVVLMESIARAQHLAGMLPALSDILQQLARMVDSEKGTYLLREALLVHQIAPDGNYPHEVRKSICAKFDAIEAMGARIGSPLRFPASYFPLSYHGICNRDLVKRLAQIYLKAVPSLGWTAPHVHDWNGSGKRIKIGIASHFFYSHSIGNTSRGLVKNLDRERFEVVLIRLGRAKRDPMADLMDQSADHVITVEGDDLQAARESIARLSLDILFYQDIGMEPLSYFLAFARLAPIQITSFGHPDTTGIPNMDYFISSENYELAGAQEHYSERLVTLPDAGTLSYYYRPPKPAAPRSKESFGFCPKDRIYLCPQTLFKVHPDMDELFLGILEGDPDAKIILIEPSATHLRKALECRMRPVLGELAERVVYLKSLPYEDYLSLIQCADVMLDTLHFNGQNTSLEALSLNIPVVTLPGTMQRERHTYGMYAAMRFTELVAGTKEEYVQLAVRVVNDMAFRNHCQSRIAESASVLFENANFVRNCEAAFCEMIQERISAGAASAAKM